MRFLGRRNRAVEPEATPPETRDTLAELNRPRFWRSLGGLQTGAGVSVTEDSALAHSTVFACVRILADIVGHLPFNLIRRIDEQTKERATDHPLWSVVHSIANPSAARSLVAMQAKQMIVSQLMLWGNFLAFVERSGNGDVLGYHPLRWSQVKARVEGRELFYVYTPTTPGLVPEVFRSDEVWHIFGLSKDGLTGMSPIAAQREAVGHGLAMQQYGSKLFSNGARVAGVLQSDKEVGQEGVDRLREQWNEMYQGSDNANRTAVLEDGLKYNPMSIPPDDAQYLETRGYNREEIAAIFGIPGHLVNAIADGGQSFASIEQKSLDFVIFNLSPWLTLIEQTGDRDLLRRSERPRLFLKHNVDALLRGDSKTRAEVEAIYVRNGIVGRNEVRVRNDWNPLEGLDAPLVPLNMGIQNPDGSVTLISGGESGGGDVDPAEPEPPAQRRRPAPLETRQRRDNAQRRTRVARSFSKPLKVALKKVVRTDMRQTRRLVEKYLPVDGEPQVAAMLDEVQPRYAPEGEQNQVAIQHLTPPVTALASAIFELAADEVDEETEREGVDAFATAMVVGAAARYSIKSLRALELALANENPRDGVEALLDNWSENRARRAAAKETVQVARASAKEAYRRSGVTVLRWRAQGDETCPFCQALDGKVAAIEGNFLAEGETMEAEGRPPLTPRTPIGHPPLHSGCDCEIEPA